MENKQNNQNQSELLLSEQFLLHFPCSQSSIATKKIAKTVIIFIVVVTFLVIYQREFLVSNFYLGREIFHISPEDKKINFGRKKYIFVELKNIQRTIKNIFFTETSCGTGKMKKKFNGSKQFNLKPRQVCAVESTALTNPEHNIYILYTCPLANNFLIHMPNFTKSLINYPNLYIVKVNVTEAFMNTPVEELYKSKKLESSNNPAEHFSDLLRFIVLWKFGGTYLDLDVVTIKTLLKLGTNYAGIQDRFIINSAVLNAEPTGSGHKLIQKVLEFVNKNYNGKGWTSNGPEVLTRVILEECNSKKIDKKIRKCDEFHIFPRRYFYNIPWTKEGQLFKDELGPKIVENLKNNSYVVHAWNKLSWNHTIYVGSTQAYGLLANDFCPNVIKNCGKKF